MLFEFLCLFLCITSQQLNEPPDGEHYLAAWIDTVDSSPGAKDGDRPYKFNERLGFNASAFQYAQDIPISTFPFPVEQIEVLDSDTIIYLTVYPRPSPWTISSRDIRNLTQQLGKLNRQGRRIMLRWAPEFNGNWNAWGQQPARFIELWKRVHTALREDAPLTAMIWAPNSGKNYPFGGAEYAFNLPNDDDMKLLDSNGNGVLDAGDDPYLPYYPGDDYVDWVGLSVYHYGSSWPWVDNVLPIPGTVEADINVGGFYDDYVLARDKPMMIAETGATFHLSLVSNPSARLPVGPGELAIKQAWWRQYITNSTFLETHPKVKLICIFEFTKSEESTFRDWRITENPEILAAFKKDLDTVKNYYLFANGTILKQSTGSSNGDTVGSSTGNSEVAMQPISWLFAIAFLLF